MSYYKLIDGQINSPPLCLHTDDGVICNFDTLIAHNQSAREKYGYYPLNEEPPSFNQNAQSLSVAYVQNEDAIVAVYTVADLANEEKTDNYKRLTVSHIRERYDVDAEFDMINTGITDAENAQYTEYRSHVEQCKSRAHLEVYGN